MSMKIILAAGLLSSVCFGAAIAADEARRGPPPCGPGGAPGFGPPGFGGPPGFPPGGLGAMLGIMRDADANKDSKTSFAEVDALIDARFDTADANNDGRLNETEFASAMPKPPKPPADAPKPPADMPPPPKMDPGAMFRQTDWNGDGGVSADEFAIPIRAMAMRADRNGDRVIADDDRPPRPPGKPPH